MTNKTNGIILRTIKYGETSLVVTMFTSMYGLQTYMVNGVRSAKKSGAKSVMFQPAAFLEMEVYHSDLKSMQRIKESNWAYLYKHILTDVIKNSIATFMVELLHKSLKQPEENIELFDFFSDALIALDSASLQVAANFPLYISLHLPYFFGFRISNPVLPSGIDYLDLLEGSFSSKQPGHHHYLEGEDAEITSDMLKVMQVDELNQFHLNSAKRNHLLNNYINYFSLHIQDFGEMKTLPILRQVLS